MHDITPSPVNSGNTPTTEPDTGGPWYKLLNRYHWFVLVVAALGWLFDTMDQQLFNLARVPAMRDLLAPAPGVSASAADVEFYGGIATMIFLMGWATGGLAFGIMGDRFGRARTMLWTILLYSLFTGLSALSYGFWDFALYRFLTGLGVGGEFAVGVALVAEVMPNRARPYALGLLQALSAIGNIAAALISLVLFQLEESGAVGSAWRVMFVIGTLPALLAVLIRRRLKEPEGWKAISGENLKRKLGSYGELFGDPRWRRNAIVGMMLAFSGVVGLWGIGFFSIDLNRSIFRKTFEGEARADDEAVKDQTFVRTAVSYPDGLAKIDEKAVPQPSSLLGLEAGNKDPEAIWAALLALRKDKQPISSAAVLDRLDNGPKPQTAEEKKRRQAYLVEGSVSGDASLLPENAERINKRTKAINSRLGFWASITSIMLNLGAFFGINAFTYVTAYTGRKAAFAVSFLAALLSTAMVFWYLKELSHIFWMIPLMGFCQLSLFGGYAIYFPELFPTHLRSTGTSFCYNVGRFIAASGPFVLGLLTSKVFSEANGYKEGMRYAGVSMCAVFLIGILALPFAPETKGKPLPE